MKHDDFSTRMKEHYEVRSQTYLPRRSYFFLRLDGKAFHTYTKGMERPFSPVLSKIMDLTAKYLCEKIAGARIGYVQSDEITIMVTDFDSINTQAWFDGNVQKIVSISAAMATAEFNRLMYLENPDFLAKGKTAMFDSRVWLVSDPFEAENIFIWRQQDCRKNSISMAAQSMFSHKELQNKSGKVMKEMMLTKNVNWEDYPQGFRNGRSIVKETVTEPIGVCRKSDCGKEETCAYSPCYKKEEVTRSKWVVQESPVFSVERNYIRSRLPLIPNFLTDDIARELMESEEELKDTLGTKWESSLTENIELSLLKASGLPAEALETLYRTPPGARIGDTVDLRQLIPVKAITQKKLDKDYCPTTPFNDYEG